MSNYTLNNVPRLKFGINEYEYWDCHVNDSFNGSQCENSCLISYIDTSNPDCLHDTELYSLLDNTWSGACNNGLDLYNIGLTGVDNGLITFRKDRITNQEFYDLFTKSEYHIDAEDYRLHLHAVTGNTQQYCYPLSMNEDGSVKLNGGFYQGFFAKEKGYSVLPSQLNFGDVWNLEFTLKKENYQSECNNTLNDKYPENKGIFFYIGTRAENKWSYYYNGIESGVTSVTCEASEENPFFDLIQEDLDLGLVVVETDNGFDVMSVNDGYTMSDNKFLMFDRTPSGMTTETWVEGTETMLTYKTKEWSGNLFQYMNRTPSGYTTETISKVTSGTSVEYTSLYQDIYNNALAFIINDDGSIGYRYLTKDCDKPENNYIGILEGKSFPHIIKEGEWVKINVKIKADKDTMKLYFYVNGLLKYITSDLPLLNLKSLDELQEKQEGVAYNISLGGGTQGLAETILIDYTKNPSMVYPLEQYFGGSFIGDIKTFKFYFC